jgi:D-glycero-D-manno-heptose 1,7-bisphosphate phosphatase
MNKAAFLDRDGVINRKAPKGKYITRWEEVEFLPGVVDAIKLLRRSGFRVIVVTNQRCVARGLINIPELEALHQRMLRYLAEGGAIADAVYYCPHGKQAACGCRKPAPGMLLDAARDHQLDLASSWMIGDSEVDVEAGRRAGCHTARLLSPRGADSSGADLVALNFMEVAQNITLVTTSDLTGESFGAVEKQNL